MSSSFLVATSCFLLLLLHLSRADPRTTEAAIVCGNKTATAAQRQSFVSNFLASLDAVTPVVSSVGYATAVNGTGSSAVYTLGECMKDLSSSDCNLCFSQIKTQILRCYPFQSGTRSGTLVYDGCYLRFDEYNFFGESLGPGDRLVCGNATFRGNRDVFSSNAVRLMRNLTRVAVRNDGYAVGGLSGGNVSVYGLAQCWEFVKGTNCSNCLEDAYSRIASCMPREEGRVANTGCYLRYSMEKFYDNSTSSGSGGGAGGRLLAIVVSVVSSVLGLLLIAAAVLCYMKKKYWIRRREKKQLGAMLATLNKSKLNFPYETLEKSTNYFHASNKLGQGGSGSVYKGSLPDGKTVAIKRLFFNTTQWADHFFNEVNLISGIQHKNLVKLLGCSITGPESLLVYEYVPNQSLHDHLLSRRNLSPLSWEVRYNILLGTAEGLSYLHEESNLRIIHRDIKLSNILLEQDFTAKIADFGLARLFPEDRSHISTGVAGTLGYMAPEYVVSGKLTEKADVYSFGVLLIEVVCGRRNNSFSQDSISILQMVWSLYGTGRLLEAVDPLLEGKFVREQAERLLQVGLVCAQAVADSRPSMSVAAKMIANDHEIGQPTQPPFLNTNNMDLSPFMRPGTDESRVNSHSQSSANSITQSFIEAR